MVRSFLTLIFVLLVTIPSHASGILYSQNFESGAVPGQFYGGTMLSTSGVPGNIGVGNWALYNNSGGTPIGTTSNPIGLQLTGLNPFQTASLEFTFIAVDSWDGLDMGDFSNDYFNVQSNASVLFQATFKNWGGVAHYTGDGTALYGSTTPPNSTITPLSPLSNYLVSYYSDMFYDIHLDGLTADASGHLNIYFYASGAGWQGGTDESFAVDNILLTTNDFGFSTPGTDTPEPGTVVTFAGGLLGLVAMRRRRAELP